MRGFRVSLRQLKDRRWEVDYINPSSRKRHRHRFKKKGQAERAQREIYILHSKGSLPSDRRVLVSELMEALLKEDPDSRVKSQKIHFIDFCDSFGNRQIGDVDAKALRGWFQKLQDGRGISEKTCNRIKAMLAHFFNWCESNGHIDRSPLKYVKFSENVPFRRQPITLSPEEVKEILDKAMHFGPPQLYQFLYFAAHTGARKSEIQRLEWSDFNQKKKKVTFRRTKNGESRTIQISDRLVDCLNSITRTSRFIFPGNDDNPVSESRLRKWIDNLKDTADIDTRWGVHSFRHAYAHAYKSKKGSLLDLQAVLGHKTQKLTADTYGKIRGEDVSMTTPFEF